MSMMFTEDYADRHETKLRRTDRSSARRLKQMYRAFNEAVRAEEQEQRRDRRVAKFNPNFI